MAKSVTTKLDLLKDQSPLWKPKLFVTLFALVSGTGLVLLGKLTGGEWVTVVNLAVATYVAGSVVENKALISETE